MPQRKNPDTSHAAYRAVTEEMRDNHFYRILKALKVLGMASAEQLADFLGMDHVQVNRRTSEMERRELIWRSGSKVPTKTGRWAFLWTIRGDNQPTTTASEKLMKGETVSDISKKMQKTINTPLSTQLKLGNTEWL
jgi:predicted ArsR family transcriptional regulator